MKVTGSSYVQQLARHAASEALSEPASIGTTNDYADRLYQDGYVKLDISTTDTNSVGGPGNTWNWAYDNSSQYDSTAQTLSFHQQGNVGYTTLLNRPVSSEDEMAAAGIQLRGGIKLFKSKAWSLDLALGFQGMFGVESRMSTTSYRERIGQLNVTDSYDVSQTVDPITGFFPGPRTSPGGYTGQFDVPGPVIYNIPTSRTDTETVLATAENRINFHFRTDFYEWNLSPRIRYAATPKLSLHLSPSIGVALLDISAERSEVFIRTATDGTKTQLGSWHDQKNQTTVRFTAGVTGGADYDLGNDFYAGIYGGYDWAVDTARFSLGPNTISMDGSGFVAGAVVGKRF